MNHTSLSNFLNNTEDIINNIVNNKEFTTVNTKEGNVVIMTEQQYKSIVRFIRSKRNNPEA